MGLGWLLRARLGDTRTGKPDTNTGEEPTWQGHRTHRYEDRRQSSCKRAENEGGRDRNQRGTTGITGGTAARGRVTGSAGHRATGTAQPLPPGAVPEGPRFPPAVPVRGSAASRHRHGRSRRFLPATGGASGRGSRNRGAHNRARPYRAPPPKPPPPPVMAGQPVPPRGALPQAGTDGAAPSRCQPRGIGLPPPGPAQPLRDSPR